MRRVCKHSQLWLLPIALYYKALPSYLAMREGCEAATPGRPPRPSNFSHVQNGEMATQRQHNRPSNFAQLQNGAAAQQRHGRPSSFSQVENGSDQSVGDRRSLRANYRAVKADIAECKHDPGSFDQVFGNMEHLYTEVNHPREQIADAEALLDITASLLATVKDLGGRRGRNASEFVTAVIKVFGTNAVASDERIEPVLDFERLGREACAVFLDAPGMTTMIGPMESQQKQRKTPQRRPRDRLLETARPEELRESVSSTTQTDKNMEAMFTILKRNKTVYLEDLVLNRLSFAQTVENIFSLSFLVKDGRAEISINNGRHIVRPMNFPTQQQREQGKGSMNQFVLRFDFKDWQVMKEMVQVGGELMPNRDANQNRGSSIRVKKE